MRQTATYEDLLRVSDLLVAEIVEGELFTSPLLGPRHALAKTRLSAELYTQFADGGDRLGNWWILNAPGVHLGADVLVPDIVGWRRKRMPTFPDVAWFDLAPDWICEVVSPATARLDRLRKLPRYAQHGIQWAWIIDPIAKGLEVYHLEHERWSLISTHEGATLVRAEPFDACDIDLGALWIEP